MSQPFAPTVEFTRAVCTCGKELPTIFYQLTAKAHFEKFAADIGLMETDVANIGFIQEIPTSLSFCCLMNLRYGIREPIAIVPPPEQDSRKYPDGLPDPLSKEKTLSWY